MPEFEMVQQFESRGLVVEVYRCFPERGPAMYSVRVGKQITKKEDGVEKTFVAPHIRVYQDRACITRAQLERPFAAELAGMLESAEQWIVGDMAERHEFHLAQMRDREQRDAERGKLRTRRTGKTERDRDKRRRRSA